MMSKGFTQILLFWLLGETLTLATQLPISGSVLGMFLLFAWLMIQQRLDTELEKTANLLISQLSLLLLPGGVGIFFLGAQLEGQWTALLAAIVGGTLLSTAACMLLMRFLLQRGNK